jgi:hypothetical protein
MALPTGPVTTRASANLGDATKWMPNREQSKIAFVVAATSRSVALHPVETSRTSTERLNGVTGSGGG